MEETTATSRGEKAAEISRGGVQILREYTGRGPMTAWTVINTDLVAIVFSDTLTKGEANLVEFGESEHVLETRRQFQRAMKDDLVGLVESTLGRKVIAFMSANHIDPDLAVESFVLERDGNHGAEVSGTAADLSDEQQ